MSISPTCDYCKQELKTFGGILLSPPDSNNMVHKYHICQVCYEQVTKDIK